MKNDTTMRNLVRRFCLCAVLLTACAGILETDKEAQAGVLLTVDVSNPSNVTFAATGANAAIDTNGAINSGISLLGFFQAAPSATFWSAPVVGTSTLMPTNTQNAFPSPYFYMAYLDSGNSYPLAVYGGANGQEVFSSSSAALSGSMPLDLSNAGSGVLPAVGTVGDMMAGYSGDNFGTIGQWQAVPEPSTCAMALAGLACGGYSMFRSRRAR